MFSINKVISDFDKSLMLSNKIMDGEKLELQQVLVDVANKYIKSMSKWGDFVEAVTEAKVNTRKFSVKKVVGYETYAQFIYEGNDVDEDDIYKNLNKFISELTKICIKYDRDCTIKKNRPSVFDHSISRKALLSDKTIVSWSFEVISDRWLTISIGIQTPDKSVLLKRYAGDDRVIRQIANLLKLKLSKNIDAVCRIIDKNRPESAYIAQNYGPKINKDIKKAFALCTKISDKKVAARITSFLEEIFHTDINDLDNALQNFLEANDYYSIDFYELVELTFDVYLKTHDLEQAFA